MNIIAACVYTLLGTGFTLVMTSCGAGTVFLVKENQSARMQRLFLGFASGIMLAASVWSLLLPALDQAEKLFSISWIPVAGGFLLGGLFFSSMDVLLSHLVKKHNEPMNKGSIGKLFTAITLHNIPEGMAIGLSFTLAVQDPVNYPIVAALTLAVGIGVQNFPEGAAVSLPLYQEGMKKRKAFLYGSLSGMVEPLGGVVTVFLVRTVQYLLPWLLSFAAGAMIYVVVDELIPNATKNNKSNICTIGAMIGFLLMMILDVTIQ